MSFLSQKLLAVYFWGYFLDFLGKSQIISKIRRGTGGQPLFGKTQKIIQGECSPYWQIFYCSHLNKVIDHILFVSDFQTTQCALVKCGNQLAYLPLCNIIINWPEIYVI